MSSFKSMCKKPKLDLIGSIKTKVHQITTQNYGGDCRDAVSGLMAGVESMSEPMRDQLQSTFSSVESQITSMCNELGMDANDYAAGIESASYTQMMLGDSHMYTNWANAKLPNMTTGNKFEELVGHGGFPGERTALAASIETYKEHDFSNFIEMSVGYNLLAPRQDPFAEAFFPTIVISPEQPGVRVSIRVPYIQNDLRRNTTGDINQLIRKNLVQAYVDPEILKADELKVIPIYRDEPKTKEKFVDPAFVMPYDVKIDGTDEVVTTAPLKFDVEADLMSLSQSDTLINTGLADISDILDKTVKLKNIYLQMTDDAGGVKETVQFYVKEMYKATFYPAVQDNTQKMKLDFDSHDITIHKDNAKLFISPGIPGANSALLSAIITNDLIVRISVNIHGTISLDTSIYSGMMAGAIKVLGVFNGVTREELPATNALVIALTKQLQANSKWGGFDLDVRRANVNRRQRGRLADSQEMAQLYTVKIGTPITTPRPAEGTNPFESTDLANLVSLTRAATTNDAIYSLINAENTLRNYRKTKIANQFELGTGVLGVGRYIIEPYFNEITIDLAKELNNLESKDAFDNIAAVILNNIRNEVYTAYSASNYKAAYDYITGTDTKPPVVVAGTDKVISQFMMISGDLRSLGNDFQMQTVSTVNKLIHGTIYVTFKTSIDGNGVLDPLSFGNMLWRPEMVFSQQIPRNGGISKEITVTPSYEHFINLPILMKFNVTNIPEAFTKKSILKVIGSIVP